MIFLSETSSDHHYHEREAKETIPSFLDTLTGMPFYLVSIVLRVSILGILSAYLQWRVLFLLATLVFFNYFAAKAVLKTAASKNVW